MSRRPEGMHREVFALLYKDSKDAPPLLPTDTGKFGFNPAKGAPSNPSLIHRIWI